MAKIRNNEKKEDGNWFILDLSTCAEEKYLIQNKDTFKHYTTSSWESARNLEKILNRLERKQEKEEEVEVWLQEYGGVQVWIRKGSFYTCDIYRDTLLRVGFDVKIHDM